MRILIAPDKFKGCLSATDVAEAIASGVRVAGGEPICMPLADGGEGTAAILAASVGASKVKCSTVDPLHRPIQGEYFRKADTAYLDVAAASGMWLLQEDERCPLLADTYGTGLLMADAIRRGCRKFIIGLGGSATVDGGAGMMAALEEDPSLTEALRGSTFTLLTDVAAPLCGSAGAAQVFGPQKGATPDDVRVLEERLLTLAHRMGVDPAIPGLGAAGGFGLMLCGLYGEQTRIAGGAGFVLDHTGFDAEVRRCDAVVTGEGHIDRQTLMGKLPMEVMRRARYAGVDQVAAFAGKVDDREALTAAGFTYVAAIHAPGISHVVAMDPALTRTDLTSTAMRWMSEVGIR